jgi:DNA-binding response OmpR family regulator
VIVTAKADLPSIDRAYEVGATDLASKPIDWALLGHHLRYLLRASRAPGAVKQSERSLANAQRIAHVGSWEWSLADDRMTGSDETFRILGFAPGSIEANPRDLRA